MIYTPRRVDGPAHFQSARIDGAAFVNFDTRKGRDIHRPFFWVTPSMPECVANVFQGCAIYAGGKGKGERRKGKEKEKGGREGERERRRGKKKGKGTVKGGGTGERRKGKGQGIGFFCGKP